MAITGKTFTEDRQTHLPLTQEHTTPILLVKVPSLEAHLASSITTMDCSTTKACLSMAHMAMVVMVEVNQ